MSLSIQSRQKLIKDFRWFAEHQAKLFCSKYYLQQHLEDFKSIAIIGLCKAARKYQRKKAIPFKNFAVIYIVGSMLDEFRKMDFCSRSERKFMADTGQILYNDDKFVSLSDFVDTNTDTTFEDIIVSDFNVETKKEQQELIIKLLKIIQHLPIIEKKIMCLHLCSDHFSYKEIGQVLGYSESRIAQIYNEALEKIKGVINGTNQRE